MSYHISRVYVAPVPKMPPGLIELMEGLTKDVLRNNPTNIYEFCADHMEKLLKIRDGNKRNTLSLQRKITKAQEIIRERAKQHRQNYDNMLQQHYLESENDVSNSVHKDVTAIHIQQASTKTLKDSLGIKPEDDVVFTGEVEIKSEKDNEVSSPTQEIVENKLPNDICTNTTLENLGGLESDNQNKNINLEEILYSNITDMTNVNMGTDVVELIDVTQKDYANINEDDISGNNFENTISGQNEESRICESKDKNKEACSTEESDNNTQSFIEGEDFESAFNIPDNCQLEDDKPKSENNSEKRLCEVNNETIVKCANVVPEELENNLNNEVIHHNVMDLETAAITIQKVFRTFLFKSKTTSIDDATNVDINLFLNDNDLQNDNNSNINANKERRGITRMDTVLQTVNEEKSSSLSTDDSLSSAATVIQAHIRGFLVRNKLNVNKSSSPTSLVDSDVLSGASLEIDNDQQKTKTVLNIHIVPERDHFVSRDESLLTSVDLSMDGPPSMSNLHPHSYDLSERRKQLKREDAVQSVSPPSNNSSSKLSEDVESVREILTTEISNDSLKHNGSDDLIHKTDDEINATSHEIQTAVENEVTSPQRSLEKLDKMCDEMDVVTPFVDEKSFDAKGGKLMHSSEFHDVVLPTKVSRNDTTVVRGE